MERRREEEESYFPPSSLPGGGCMNDFQHGGHRKRRFLDRATLGTMLLCGAGAVKVRNCKKSYFGLRDIFASILVFRIICDKLLRADQGPEILFSAEDTVLLPTSFPGPFPLVRAGTEVGLLLKVCFRPEPYRPINSYLFG